MSSHWRYIPLFLIAAAVSPSAGAVLITMTLSASAVAVTYGGVAQRVDLEMVVTSDTTLYQYNALAETNIGLYKTEVICKRGPWRGIEAIEFATLTWVDCFNHRRLLESNGHEPPAELEAAFHAQTGESALVA